MRFTWVNVLLLLGGVIGAGLFGYSLVQQTALQSRMNDTMALINRSIVSTGAVVKQTSQSLQPLVETTTALATIEQQEERTVTALNSMNAHLSKTAESEKGLITGLDNLNKVTSGVSSDITSMQGVNDSLLQLGGRSVSQAQQEAQQVGTLNQLTKTSIDQLRTLNQKLSPLRVLP
ncbi:MAG: hypothetical protein ACXVDB_05310 [Tumebacillaceae bacterium]